MEIEEGRDTENVIACIKVYSENFSDGGTWLSAANCCRSRHLLETTIADLDSSR